jgi:hypothetical protein
MPLPGGDLSDHDLAPSSSGRSVIAIGELTPWNDIRERPRTFFNRSASTFIGPGDGAEPGAGCGKAVDIAVWKVT